MSSDLNLEVKSARNLKLLKIIFVFLVLLFLLFIASAEIRELGFISKQLMLLDSNITDLKISVYNNTWLEFDGVDDYVGIYNNGDLDFNSQSNYTFSSWVYLEGDRKPIYSIGLAGSEGISFVAGSGEEGFGIMNLKDYTIYRVLGIKENTWTYILCTYNGAKKEIECYANGVLIQEAENNFNWTNLRDSDNQELRIGNAIGSDSYFKGAIDRPAVFNYLLANYNYSINRTYASFNDSTVYMYNDTRYYALFGGYLKRSDDGGRTWKNAKPLTKPTETIFIDSRKNIFLTTIGTGNISKSNIENDNKWEEIKVIDYKNEYGEGFGYGTEWGFTETKEGTLLLGEYEMNAITNRSCVFIHRSIDGGSTWEIVYDGNKQFPESPARHMHLVRADPYTGYIYATQGDSPSSRLLRSTDDGKTWESLENISGTSQYLSLVFTPEYRIFGTDKGSGNNKIVRTKDDKNFETVYSLPTYADGYFWDMERDNKTGFIVAGTQTISDNKSSMLLISPDNGTNWFAVYEKIQNRSYKGISKISQFNSNGYFYYSDNDLKASFYSNIITSNCESSNGIKIEDINKSAREIFIGRDNILYGIFGGLLKKSEDGTSWSDNLMPKGYSCEEGLFIDSRGTIFCTENNNNRQGILRYSKGNETNWKDTLNYICINSTSRYQLMTEDSDSNLYAGEYTYGHNQNCSYVYKSTDGGFTWKVVYNGSQDPYGGRHIHFVKADPYNNCVYASVGDSGIGGASSQISRLIRSCNGGESWEVLLRGNVDYQFLVAAFTKNYRLFGTDSSKNNKIYRTFDDNNFEVVYRFNSPYDGQPHVFDTDNNGYLYLGTNSINGNRSIFLWSADEGKTWEILLDLGQTKTNTGFDKMSNFNKDNYAYVYDNFNMRMLRFKLLTASYFYNVYNLNENMGEVAYDLSRNENYGTIYGATWHNDGTLRTLKEGIDYTANTTTGELIPSDKYLYTWFNVTYFSDANDSSNDEDTTPPIITSTLPKDGFATGTFEVNFIEENPKELSLTYGNETDFRLDSVDLESCSKEGEETYCSIEVNLNESRGQEITYYFYLEDIAGNYDESEEITLEVENDEPPGDKTPPVITGTSPTDGFASGAFEVEFIEENPKELWLTYGNETDLRAESVELDSCVKEGEETYCFAEADLSEFDGQEITYYFYLEDIAGNYDESPEITLPVDFTPPILNNLEYSVSYNYNTGRRQISYKFNVSEPNFDSIKYIDRKNGRIVNSGTLCSSLNNGICTATKQITVGKHYITIQMLDLAGNSDSFELVVYS